MYGMVRDKYMHAKARMLDPLQTLQPNFCWRSKVCEPLARAIRARGALWLTCARRLLHCRMALPLSSSRRRLS